MPDHKQLAEYLRRSYHAVDGLWFVMAEEAHDFDHALALDRRVWQVLAKIQARKARDLTHSTGNTPDDLARCFTLKLTADGHQFDTSITPAEVTFTIHRCPWLELLRNSNRQHVAAKVAQTICPTEGRVWCAEFGGDYEFDMPLMACADLPAQPPSDESATQNCHMRFHHKSA